MSADDDRDVQIRQGLAALSGTDAADWHLVNKGRHAMATVLGALTAGEVITQPLTCLTAVAPAISAGHVPRYADIDPRTLAIDPGSAARGISGRTRAVIGQHTFGAAGPLAELRELTPEGALLMEDSCHCLGEIARDGDGRPVADVSVHSFGLEKMLATRTGAAVWVNPDSADRPWHAPVVAALRSLPTAGVRRRVSDLVSPTAQKLARRLGGPGGTGLALAARTGLVDQVIQTDELSGEVQGPSTRPSAAAAAAIARELPTTEASRRHRRMIAEIYRAGLAQAPGVTRPAALDLDERVLVRYPVLLGSTAQAEGAFAAMQAAGLVPGRWYRPLLFPGPSDPSAFGYVRGSCPVAEDVSARLLNLPTAPFVTDQAARHTVQVVAEHAR